jgi:predicted dehydrogenase
MQTFAVVGMGSIAKRHLSNLRKLHPDDKIYVVSATGTNTKLPDNATSIITIEELIDCKPEYVIVASPATQHIDIAERLLAQNIPVLIEKPLAHNGPTCATLTHICNETPLKKVAVGYCLRFLPSAKAVKSCLDSGLLGEIYNVEAHVGQYLPEWRSDKDFKNSVSASKILGGGALLELSHELDYLHWFMGDLYLQHSWLRTSEELGLEVEDIADLVLLSEANVYVSVHLDFIQKSPQRRCEFIGQNGRLEWDLIGNTVIYYHAGGREIVFSEPGYDKNGMYLDMLDEFENLVPGSVSKLATITSATKIVDLIDEAKRLNKSGQHR